MHTFSSLCLDAYSKINGKERGKRMEMKKREMLALKPPWFCGVKLVQRKRKSKKGSKL